jgi:hypothetical protein
MEFAAALGSRDVALRRDECGDWRIMGSHGHIYSVPEGFQVFVMNWTTRGWSRAKETLSFAKLCNDGDVEGAFILDRLPTRAEAAALRKWCGVAKRKEFSLEHLAELRERGSKLAEKRHRVEEPVV